MNPSRNHHFLPRFYLRHFADSNGEILETFKDENGRLQEKRTGPGGLGRERDLYSLTAEASFSTPPESDDIEVNVFGPIDNAAAPVMKKLIDLAPSALTTSEREAWARFVNSLTERHPQRLRDRDADASKFAMDRVEAFIAAGPTEESRSRRRETLEMMDHAAVAKNIVRGLMVREIDRTDVIAHFRDAKWLKIHLDDPAELPVLTGDHPVVANAGLAWPIQFLSLALSPNDLFCLYRDEQLPDVDTIVKIVIAHGLEILNQCEYVYSRDPLVNGDVVTFRRGAENALKKIPWRR